MLHFDGYEGNESIDKLIERLIYDERTEVIEHENLNKVDDCYIWYKAFLENMIDISLIIHNEEMFKDYSNQLNEFLS